jgi:hypothetical protein
MLTDVEQELKARIPDLLDMLKAGTLTLSFLVMFTVTTAVELGLITPDASMDEMSIGTEGVMRNSLTEVHNSALYADDGDDPTLTHLGMNHLMLEGMHPLSVQYRNIVDEIANEAVRDIYESFSGHVFLVLSPRRK